MNSFRVTATALLSALSFSMACSATLAQTACPDETTAARGYVLSGQDVRIEVLPFDGDIVQYVLSEPGRTDVPVAVAKTWQGLILHEHKRGGTLSTIQSGADYKQMLPLRPIEKFEFPFVLKVDGTDRPGRNIISLAKRASPLNVGACSYEVWMIQANVEFNDGEKSLVTSYYSPVLRMWLRREHAALLTGNELYQQVYVIEQIAGR